jgi:hypothetical protein
VIKWEELSDREFKRLGRIGREIHQMRREELEEEILRIRNELASAQGEKRQELLERLELAEKEKEIREEFRREIREEKKRWEEKRRKKKGKKEERKVPKRDKYEIKWRRKY